MAYSAEQIAEVGQLFGLAVTSHERLALGSRWMGQRYSISTTSGRFFLKIRSEWWPPRQASYVCELQRHLNRLGLPVPAALAGASDSPLVRWNGHLCECHAWVDGHVLDANDLEQVFDAGLQLRRFHAAVDGYPPPGGALPPGCGYPWRAHVDYFADRVARLEPSQADATRLVAAAVEGTGELEGGSPAADPIGLTHGDYHHANLLVRGIRVAAITDLDFVQATARAYDLSCFLYRAAGVAARAGGVASRLDRNMADTFADGYAGQQRLEHTSVGPVSGIARELSRLAWYECLLAANNGAQTATFPALVTDTQALVADVADWARLWARSRAG